jgi:hypothetical protein
MAALVGGAVADGPVATGLPDEPREKPMPWIFMA